MENLNNSKKVYDYLQWKYEDTHAIWDNNIMWHKTYDIIYYNYYVCSVPDMICMFLISVNTIK